MDIHYSYVRANAMASSNDVGCSNSTLVFSEFPDPTVKILIWCFSTKPSQRASKDMNLLWNSATVPSQQS
jgi:hypothetical protein